MMNIGMKVIGPNTPVARASQTPPYEPPALQGLTNTAAGDLERYGYLGDRQGTRSIGA